MIAGLNKLSATMKGASREQVSRRLKHHDGTNQKRGIKGRVSSGIAVRWWLARPPIKLLLELELGKVYSNYWTWARAEAEDGRDGFYGGRIWTKGASQGSPDGFGMH